MTAEALADRVETALLAADPGRALDALAALEALLRDQPGDDRLQPRLERLRILAAAALEGVALARQRIAAGQEEKRRVRVYGRDGAVRSVALRGGCLKRF